MTEMTQSRMNVVLALMIPAVGLAFLTSGFAPTASGSAVGALLAVLVLWPMAIVALTTIRRPQPAVVNRVPAAMHNVVPRRSATPPYVVDVSRPSIPWRWTSVLLAPVELLAIAWSVPFVILLIILAGGLAVASVLWVGRLIVGT